MLFQNQAELWVEMPHSCNLLGAIDDNSLLVHDVDNGAHLASARAICDEGQTAWLNEAREHRHCRGECWGNKTQKLRYCDAYVRCLLLLSAVVGVGMLMGTGDSLT